MPGLDLEERPAQASKRFRQNGCLTADSDSEVLRHAKEFAGHNRSLVFLQEERAQGVHASVLQTRERNCAELVRRPVEIVTRVEESLEQPPVRVQQAASIGGNFIEMLQCDTTQTLGGMSRDEAEKVVEIPKPFGQSRICQEPSATQTA